jgi:hypothetical protein
MVSMTPLSCDYDLAGIVSFCDNEKFRRIGVGDAANSDSDSALIKMSHEILKNLRHKF